MNPSPKPPDVPHEHTLIELLHRRFSAHAPAGQTPDYSDDCAHIDATRGETRATSGLLITTDALCEGVHFDLSWDSYVQVGAQAAVANLSDLASSGAEPSALLWSLSLPATLTPLELDALAEGFGRVAAAACCPVVGGNICVRSGALEVHVTALGVPITTPITRLGARPGDAVYVTGELGERALGYLDPSAETRALRHQWRPHLSESRALAHWGAVSAMLDISDGLLLDLGRLARLNKLDVELTSALIPMSAYIRAHPLGVQAALSGGEDYVLLFTAPAGLTPPPEVGARRIGLCVASREERPTLRIDGVSCAESGHLYTIARADALYESTPNLVPKLIPNLIPNLVSDLIPDLIPDPALTHSSASDTSIRIAKNS